MCADMFPRDDMLLSSCVCQHHLSAILFLHTPSTPFFFRNSTQRIPIRIFLLITIFTCFCAKKSEQTAYTMYTYPKFRINVHLLLVLPAVCEIHQKALKLVLYRQLQFSLSSKLIKRPVHY